MKVDIHAIATSLAATIVFALVASTAWAGAVSNVNGNLTKGAVVTITGNGFGNKSSGPPLYFWDFGSSLGLSPLSRGHYTGAIRGALNTAVVAPGSASSLRADVAGITEAFGPTDGVPFSSNTLYVWAKKYYGFNIVTDRASNGLNLKFFRLWDPWNHDIYTSYQGSSGAQSGLTYPEGTADSGKWWTIPHESKKWIVDEWEYQASDVGAANGVLNYTRGGRSAYARSTRFLMRTAAQPARYSMLFFDQISNNQLSPGKYLYFDSIYVDDTLQRVLISDEPTWQSVVYSSGVETIREVQIPITWTDSRIEVTVRPGALGSLNDRYLYVIAADGTPVNETGFRLSGSGVPVAVPNPPVDVQVQ